jgi:protein-L-isoaspartate(D-aspartate) O-methyltransferase
MTGNLKTTRQFGPGRFFTLAVLSAACLAASARADLVADRNRMVDEEIVAAGVKDPRVIQSMRDTPRHEFMPLTVRSNAYYDMALAIGFKQTISPPFVVAYMTEQLKPEPTDTVLEIGTGSGYQAAVLSPLVKDVYTIEIVKPLGLRAARTLRRLKYENVHAKVGDGYQGWPEHAPFDKIIVTCSPEQVPEALVEQLREGGRMIVPVGERYQQTLYLFEKHDGKLKRVELLPTLFVPMTGQAEASRVVKPDSARPSINNGGFEEMVTVEGISNDGASPAESGAKKESENEPKSKPAGWHYQRQLALEEATDAPEGMHYVTFSNSEPGRGAQALQGMPVDGRKVAKLDVSLWVKADDVRPGANDQQQPVLAITFYDDNRGVAGYAWIGPWRDSFAWQHVHDVLRVPPRAREAVVRIGLSGATGKVSFDGIRIQAAD